MTDNRTLSMMVYEDWRPKPSPAQLEYYKGMANCTPSYPPGAFVPMTHEQMQQYLMLTRQDPHQRQLFLGSLIGEHIE
jgi:hypothetical protein